MKNRTKSPQIPRGNGIGGNELKRRVSGKAKRSGDFKRAKEMMEIIDNYYGMYRDPGKIDKYNLNYDLFNGRLDVNLYDDPMSIKMGGEDVVLDQNAIVHYPFISQIARAMHGEQKIRPFMPVAKDMGPRAMTMRKMKYNDMIKEMMNANIIAPMREKIFQAWMQENGVTDPRQMPPEMQQQMQSDIQNRMNARTPAEIMDYMENQYSTPTQRAAQQMTDFLVDFLDIKYKQDEGFKNAIITGEEIYYVGDRNGDVTFDVINPKYFSWLGSQHTTRYEKGDWAKYEQWFSVEASMQRHAMTLRKKDLKELEKYVEPIGGMQNIGDAKYDPIKRKVMYDLSDSTNPHRSAYEDMNVGLRNDHNTLMNLYGNVIKNFGGTYGTSLSNYGIREAHCTWRDKRLLKYVIRINPNSGQKESYWLDEHYEPQPQDTEVSEIWIDQVWEGTKLGTYQNAIYTDIKPVLGQYKSIFDPFDVDLPYYGMAFNTHMNNSKNVSPIDLGKSFQKEIDATMSNLRFDMATDIGKVFMMDLTMKPENWTWQEFMSSVKTAKIAPINTNQSGTPVDHNLAKPIDLSRIADISSKLDYLQTLRQFLVQAMLFNDARVGAIGEYATNTNTRANQSASYNQTEDFFDTHRKIVERALNGLINRAKAIYKDNDHRKEVIFDDITLTEMEVNEDFWFEANGIMVSLSGEDLRNVERVKELGLTLAQNTMSPKAVLELSMSKTPTDVMDIMRREAKVAQQAQQQAMEAQMQAVQAARQSEIEDRDAKFQHEFRMAAIDNQSKERRSMLEASQFERQADVDNNKVADSVERERIKEQVDREKMALDHEIKVEELKLKEKEVEIKEKVANTNKRNNK